MDVVSSQVVEYGNEGVRGTDERVGVGSCLSDQSDLEDRLA
jgi:hypothetical protein